MKTLSDHLWACVVIGVVGLAQPAEAQTADPAALRNIAVGGSDTHAVVTLTIDGDPAAAGRLQEIATPPFRVFIDLPGVVPEVAAVTPVGRAGIDRVRVALNQSSPPVTRVVLDLIGRTDYRLETDAANQAVRIIIGTPPTKPSSSSSSTAKGPTTVAEEYAVWFGRAAHRVDQLLTAVATEDAVADGHLGAWAAIRHEVESVTPPPSLKVAHDLLGTAVTLGVVATDETPSAHRQTESARAGSRLFLTRARALVAKGHTEKASAHEAR